MIEFTTASGEIGVYKNCLLYTSRTLDRNALTVRTAFRLMNGAPFLE